MKKFLPLLLIIIIISLFFKDYLIKGLIPIPADTIVGMYHPWRDKIWDNYTNGVPYKNFLITDPVRQQYPWKLLSTDYIKNKKAPLWNPYTFSGTPLLANFQSGSFYPLNIIFLLISFNNAWGIYIVLQFLLGAIFMYLYLKNLHLNIIPVTAGSLIFILSGVFIAWGEWGNLIHTYLWLPLILLLIDKIIDLFLDKRKDVKNKIILCTILILSLCSSFFAGHLQVFIYVLIFSAAYLISRVVQYKNIKLLLPFISCFLLFFIITSIQWIPTVKFINLSARSIDQINWNYEGWFIPWQNLIQFIAPDFFGNPSTLNYWGVFNYGEFIGYIGIFPIILAFFALFARKDKKTFFFGTLFFLSLIFALPTMIAKIPYQLNIPLVSTSQPTRLLFITDFSLTVLFALGLDLLIRKKYFNTLISTLAVFLFIFISLWAFVIFGKKILPENILLENLVIAKRNLIFPSVLFFISASLIILLFEISAKKNKVFILILSLILVGFDLFRFGWKYLSFSKEEWIFPKTKTIEFIINKQKKDEPFRIMTTDSRIFPPNFTIPYKIETISGYDPLYLKTYGEIIIASERGKNDITPPFGFNRIVNPVNIESPMIDFLNVKYILSLKDEKSEKLVKVFEDGETKIYENKNAFERAFIIKDDLASNNINAIFNGKINRQNTIQTVHFTKYEPQSIILIAKSDIKSTLILSNNYYPDWKVKVNGEKIIPQKLFNSVIGIPIPSGQSKIELYI